MASPLDPLLEMFTSGFFIPQEWLVFPQIVFFFAIPLAMLVIFWVLLYRRIHIFRNGAVNAVLGVVTAMITSFFIRIATPPFVVAMGVAGAIFLSGHVKAWRVIGAAAAFFATFYIFLWITQTVTLGY